MATKIKDGLTAQQHAFACAVAEGKGHSEAAIEAGYSPRSANTTAGRLLQKAAVQRTIERLRAKAAQRVEITVADVVEGLRRNAELGASIDPTSGKPLDLGASNTAYGHLGKYLRMFVDRSEVTLDGEARQHLDKLLDIIDDEVADPEVRVRIVSRFAAACGVPE